MSVSRAAASQLVFNGGFESGLSGWQATSFVRGQFISTTTGLEHSGVRSARLCGANGCNERLTQTVTVPAGVTQATFSFWVDVSSQEPSQRPCRDQLVGQLLTFTGTLLASSSTACNGASNSTWIQEVVNATSALSTYHGRTQVRFNAATDSLYPTTFYLDDVSLSTSIASPTPSPTPTQTTPPSYDFVPISSDPYTASAPGQHSSEVEPDTYAFGNTQVAAFQVGRIYDGGATDIGWATSVGGTWSHGLLPGLTTSSSPKGPFDRVSDAAVVYDAKHGTWLIVSLDLSNSGGVNGTGVAVNSSTDGLTWNNPVMVSSAPSGDYDKTWITCDNTSTSPYYGNCYVEWDNFGSGDAILMSTSTDGGSTWSAPAAPAGNPTGLGGQPLVQPNGNVVVPIASAVEGGLMSFTSSNGGGSWSAPTFITGVIAHDTGSLRASPLPSAAMDSGGQIYLVWQDCRFESGCSANDLVMSTTSDGTHWSPITRVPADPTGSHIDHFIPGIAVNPATSGATAQIALSYYYFSQTACSFSTCQLDVGYVSSTNGGTTWSAAKRLAGPMSLSWIASTSQGYMVGDYISTTFVNGVPDPIFAVATKVSGGLDEYMAADPQTVSGGQLFGAPLALPSGPNYNSGVFGEAVRLPTAR
jgi:hypothetical protein